MKGLGEFSQLHTTDESVSVDKFLKAIEIYGHLILNWVESV